MAPYGSEANDHAGAAAKAQSAADLTGTDLLFRDLARRRTRSEFQEFFEVARQLRDIQRQMVPVVQEIVEYHQKDQIEEYNRQAQRQRDLSHQYNQLVKQGMGLLRAMQQG